VRAIRANWCPIRLAFAPPLPWQPRFADLDTIITHALQWERRLSELRGG
jgi:UDP-glucose 4-epimerase